MSDLLERLREETRSLHEQTEHLLYTESLRGGTLSVDEYVHLLLIHGAFHQALERAIDSQATFFQAYTPDIRRKTPWLLADLAQVNQAIPSLPGLFTNWLPAELVGAAYVGEGSMLGGKTVWHYLQQSPVLQPLLGQARFYRGYGADTGPNWRAFGAFVTNQPTTDSNAIIDGARRAFLLYGDLFERTRRSLIIP
ncbi:biliverdin-producing heme oxygenase [Fibrella forsythiae]|uniref:Biliverdin-producing heme oxygenase n=1 Tax=Fibrella forsythiae TaxID=2817061 RepID=A0ABS3JIJ3_9BACT|nr:biliverdin-producing heme oxygenase [Fibrella forsythiae]MBO0949841.1 biliverdin-producing heme oxygenase [Fibrella forsythiae]